ncbi:type I restriction endonuclease subunit R, partial [Acinetobacter nosocomialis]|uniref:type I restriction endonuclease n=3 Tax=Acinetobacter TaxID=469 RepID=UPI000DB24C62
MRFNEDARVKIPTILHLTRLGYKYLSLKEHTWDIDSNIFPDIFIDSISRINPSFEKDDIQREYQDLKLTLDNDDLGKAFFNKLINRSGIKFIDFDNMDNNSFHVVTELTYQNGDEEFRPD